MIPRIVLKALLAAYAVLIVTATVLFGSFALASGMGDGMGARVLFWLGTGSLICLLIDSLLLLGALALMHVGPKAASDRSTDEPKAAVGTASRPLDTP